MTHVELTERECEVLRLLADGHQDKEIARRLCYSTRYIRQVIARIARKTKASTRCHAVAVAVRSGII